MNRIAAAALLATVPALSFASPISQPVDNDDSRGVVDLEFWGSVYEIDAGFPDAKRFTGEKIHGTLRVDPSLAPADRFPADHGVGRYTWDNNIYCGAPDAPACLPQAYGPSRFVGDSLVPFRTVDASLDDVFIEDHGSSPSTFDRLNVTDREYSAVPGKGPVSSFSLSLELDLPSNLVHGDGTEQQFDVRPGEGKGSGEGLIATWLAGAKQSFVSFAVDRIRATPKTCHP